MPESLQHYAVDLLFGGDGAYGEQLLHIGQYVAQTAVHQVETIVLDICFVKFIQPHFAEMERLIEDVEPEQYRHDDGNDGQLGGRKRRLLEIGYKVVVGFLIASVVVK